MHEWLNRWIYIQWWVTTDLLDPCGPRDWDYMSPYYFTILANLCWALSFRSNGNGEQEKCEQAETNEVEGEKSSSRGHVSVTTNCYNHYFHNLVN